MAAGWYARGDAPMLVRFTPRPRRLSLALPPPGPRGRRHLRPARRRCRRASSWSASSARWRGRCRPCADPEAERYAHTIPSPSADPRSHPGDRGRRAGRSWGTPRPWPTRSPARASTTRCARPRCWPRRSATSGSPARYPERVLARLRPRPAEGGARCSAASTPPASRGAWCDTPRAAPRSATCSATSCSASRATSG